MQETGTAPRSFNLWRWLTEPHPRISDIEMRRQSRLLASIIVVIMVTSTLAALALTVSESVDGRLPDAVLTLLPVQAVTLIVYLINRSGRYRVAAGLFIGLNFFAVHFLPALAGVLAWLVFVPMMIIISAILAPFPVIVGLAIASFAIQIGLAILLPDRTEMNNISLLVVSGVTVPLVLVFMRHRQLLEKERRHELERANQRLRDSELLLERRVIERTQQLEVARNEAEAARVEAEAARDRAERADRIKSQFLASMSHELRTPLNAVLTFNELMSMGVFGPVNDEQVDYLSKSLASGRHLLSLINDLLDITKIESGMMKLFIEEDFEIEGEMVSIAATAEKMLNGRAVRVITDVDEDLPAMKCDKRRVRQILLNLVSNAVKFTEEGSITLSAKRRGDQVLFAVMDTGPGIPSEQHSVVFEPFQQTETGIRHAGGTGLGLPITMRLAQAHGGRVWLESEKGQGAAFFVELPLEARVKPEQLEEV